MRKLYSISQWTLFEKEKNCDNGFNTRFDEKQIQKFLNKKYDPSGIDAPDSSIYLFFVITLLWIILQKTSFWTGGFIRYALQWCSI